VNFAEKLMFFLKRSAKDIPANAIDLYPALGALGDVACVIIYILHTVNEGIPTRSI